jgi:hypothetical protein
VPIVSVNISGVVAATLRALPKRADKKVIVRQLGAAAMKYWKDQAKQGLRSSSQDYVNGLQHQMTGDVARVTLRGMVPNMIENGWSGGDMRTWLLKGKNAKMGEHGMYNTVPFRHGTPGTSGRHVGRPMDRKIYAAAKRLAPTLSRLGGGGAQAGKGRRLHPNVFRMSRQAKAILNTPHRPWHSTSIYRDMIREEKTYKQDTSSHYMTFRRISAAKTDARSWYHKGIAPRRYARATAKHVESIAQSIVLSVAGS